MVRPQRSYDGLARKAETDRFRLPAACRWRQAGAGGRRVSCGGAALRPDERPDVGRPAPRLEGRAGHRRQSAASRQTRPFALLDLAGGTGDVAFRVVDGGRAAAPTSPSPTSTPTCSRSAASAPPSAARHDVEFVEANAEALPFPDRALRRRHHRVRHPQRAAHRRGARRSPPRAEDRRAFPLPGIFLRRRAGLDRLYDFYSFNVIPALGRAVTGDAEAYRYLVESIRKFPRPETFAEHDARRGLRAASRSSR